jgi:hypothetical protein
MIVTQQLVLLALHLQHTALGACYYYRWVWSARFALWATPDDHFLAVALDFA